MKPRQGPEPKPSGDKLYRLKELQKETRAHCLAWYRWRWGEEPALDFKAMHDAWIASREIERRARGIRDALRGKLAAVEAFAAEYAQGSGGEVAEGLLRAAPAMRNASHRLEAAFKVPAVTNVMKISRPSLVQLVAARYVIPEASRLTDADVRAARQRLNTVAAGLDIPRDQAAIARALERRDITDREERKRYSELHKAASALGQARFQRQREDAYASSLEDIKVDELAVYSILAGFWPETIDHDSRRPDGAPRVRTGCDLDEGVSVRGALSEEKKTCRQALADYLRGKKNSQIPA